VRVYLACTVRGDRSATQAARRIAGRLLAHGHEVLTAHLLEDGVEQAESSLSEREVYERDRQWLDSCDALVAEASGSSYGVGFEVGYVTARAEASGQRVVVVYEASRRGAVSRLVSGYTARCGGVFAYESVTDLEGFIDAQFTR
jgi:2'-deoxynucleoside 5'-phosphate N-hydrolase